MMDIMFRIVLIGQYENIKKAPVTITSMSNTGNTYYAKGQVQFYDAYGDYAGKLRFDATYELNDKTFSQKELDLFE